MYVTSVVLVLVMAITLTKVHGQLPEIVDEILPEVKPKGSTGYLNCTVVNKPESQKVCWQKGKMGGIDSFDISEEDRILVANNIAQGEREDSGEPKYEIIVTTLGLRIRYTLIVRVLSEEDSGFYTCYIRQQNQDWQTWPSKLGELMVQVAPTMSLQMQSVYERPIGGNITLRCDAFGNPAPNITWRREDGKFLPNGKSQSWGADLQLINIGKKDRGNYICVADNSVRPPARFTVEVKVFYAPSCFAVQNTVGQAQNRGFNAKLECIVTGYPTPSMHWEKLQNGERYQISDGDDYSTEKLSSTENMITDIWYTLLVKNVQANDYTEYYCVATNTYGRNETTFMLFETEDCQGPTCLSNITETEDCEGPTCPSNMTETEDCQGPTCPSNMTGEGNNQSGITPWNLRTRPEVDVICNINQQWQRCCLFLQPDEFSNVGKYLQELFHQRCFSINFVRYYKIIMPLCVSLHLELYPSTEGYNCIILRGRFRLHIITL
ncbi:lachesin-like isoform X4 [Argopecten irradians]|uniref:lachesin-like isoform X4 n=1 Tax=Argopecten irradians TaxID=31199 RepID=UPI003714EBC0